MQQTISRKIYLELPAPTEDDARSDRERILESLPPEYGKVEMSLSVLRTLYPMCRDAAYHLTVTLVFCGRGWEVLRVEPGDTSNRLYAAAVDYGSTTLVMQVVDLNTGEVLREWLEEIPTLYKIDLVDLDTCGNKLLLEDIRQYGRKIYEEI